MARSKCPSCGNHTFELSENTPNHSEYKMYFIQCSSCGTVVGTTGYFNAGVLVKKLEEKIEDLEQKLNYLISVSD